MKEQFWISNIELKLFESYLSDREQVSFFNGAMSAPKMIVCGVLKDQYWAPYCSYCILMIHLIVLRSQPHAYILTIHRYFHLRKSMAGKKQTAASFSKKTN